MKARLSATFHCLPNAGLGDREPNPGYGEDEAPLTCCGVQKEGRSRVGLLPKDIHIYVKNVAGWVFDLGAAFGEG